MFIYLNHVYFIINHVYLFNSFLFILSFKVTYMTKSCLMIQLHPNSFNEISLCYLNFAHSIIVFIISVGRNFILGPTLQFKFYLSFKSGESIIGVGKHDLVIKYFSLTSGKSNLEPYKIFNAGFTYFCAQNQAQNP